MTRSSLRPSPHTPPRTTLPSSCRMALSRQKISSSWRCIDNLSLCDRLGHAWVSVISGMYDMSITRKWPKAIRPCGLGAGISGAFFSRYSMLVYSVESVFPVMTLATISSLHLTTMPLTGLSQSFGESHRSFSRILRGIFLSRHLAHSDSLLDIAQASWSLVQITGR